MNIKEAYERSVSMIDEIDTRFDMDADEITDIHQKSTGPVDGIMTGFRFGYMQGMKAAAAGKVKRRFRKLIDDKLDKLDEETERNIYYLILGYLESVTV